MLGKRQMACFVVLLVSVSRIGLAQGAGVQQALADEFHERLVTLTRAAIASDSAVLDIVVHEEFEIALSRGDGSLIRLPRRTWLRQIAPVRLFEYEHVQARRVDGTVVVNAIYSERRGSTRPSETRFVLNDVWVQVGTNWQIAARTQAALGGGGA